MRKLSVFNIAALILGIGFLYLPIVILVVYSFNASRLVAVWGGWSMRWYVALAQDAARACDHVVRCRPDRFVDDEETVQERIVPSVDRSSLQLRHRHLIATATQRPECLAANHAS